MDRHLTSAQRALGIQEILCIVLGHFSPERWLDTDEERSGKVTLRELRRNLTNFARVSRFFSGPALNILWSVIDDLDPLLCLFACCRWVQVEDDGSGSEAEDSKATHKGGTGEPSAFRVCIHVNITQYDGLTERRPRYLGETFVLMNGSASSITLDLSTYASTTTIRQSTLRYICSCPCATITSPCCQICATSSGSSDRARVRSCSI